MYPNLKLQIFKLGIRQTQVARELGLSDAVLSKIICGYRIPSEAERKRLAAYLQVEEDWLFERYENGRWRNAATVAPAITVDKNGGH